MVLPMGQSVNKTKIENIASASVSWRLLCSLHQIVKDVGLDKHTDEFAIHRKNIGMSENVMFVLSYARKKTTRPVKSNMLIHLGA